MVPELALSISTKSAGRSSARAYKGRCATMNLLNSDGAKLLFPLLSARSKTSRAACKCKMLKACGTAGISLPGSMLAFASTSSTYRRPSSIRYTVIQPRGSATLARIRRNSSLITTSSTRTCDPAGRSPVELPFGFTVSVVKVLETTL